VSELVNDPWPSTRLYLQPSPTNKYGVLVPDSNPLLDLGWFERNPDTFEPQFTSTSITLPAYKFGQWSLWRLCWWFDENARIGFCPPPITFVPHEVSPYRWEDFGKNGFQKADFPRWMDLTLEGSYGWFAPTSNPTIPYTPYLIANINRDAWKSKPQVTWQVRQVGVDDEIYDEISAEIRFWAAEAEWDDMEGVNNLTKMMLTWDNDEITSLRILNGGEEAVHNFQLEKKFVDERAIVLKNASSRRHRVKVRLIAREVKKLVAETVGELGCFIEPSLGLQDANQKRFNFVLPLRFVSPTDLSDNFRERVGIRLARRMRELNLGVVFVVDDNYVEKQHVFYVAANMVTARAIFPYLGYNLLRGEHKKWFESWSTVRLAELDPVSGKYVH